MSGDNVLVFLNPGRQLPGLRYADLDKFVRRQYITEARFIVRTSVFASQRRLGGTPEADCVHQALAFCGGQQRSARKTGYSNMESVKYVQRLARATGG